MEADGKKVQQQIWWKKNQAQKGKVKNDFSARFTFIATCRVSQKLHIKGIKRFCRDFFACFVLLIFLLSLVLTTSCVVVLLLKWRVKETEKKIWAGWKIDHYVMSWIFLVDVENFSSVLFSCVLFLIAMNPRTSSAMLKSRSAPEWSSTKKKVEHKMKSQQADNAESCKKISSAVLLRQGWWVWREKIYKNKMWHAHLRIKIEHKHSSKERGARGDKEWTTMMFAT